MSEIFPFMPLKEPKITLKTQVHELGREKLAKFYTAPSKRDINAEFYLHDLAELRAFESFFIKHLGALKSFDLPSFKRDFIASGHSIDKNYIEVNQNNSSLGLYRQDLQIYIKKQGFISRVLDIKIDLAKHQEIVFLADSYNFEINPDTIIWELIKVRFNSDELKFTQKGAKGYYVSVNFKEVLGELK